MIKDEFDYLMKEIELNQEIRNSRRDRKNAVCVALNIYTLDEGKLKIFLLKKIYDNHKKCWILPISYLYYGENIEEKLEQMLHKLRIINPKFEQSCTQTNIETKYDKNTIVISYFGLVNKSEFENTTNREYEYSFEDINNLPKLGYDNKKIIIQNFPYIKKMVSSLSNLKILLNDEFIISEIQNLYEVAYNTKYDRRNFRKKLMKLDIIEEVGQMNLSTNGRPAKYYKFKENVNDMNLF